MEANVWIQEVPEGCSYRNQEGMDKAVQDIFDQYFFTAYGKTVKDVIPSGSTVVVKPNFVHQLNFNVFKDGKRMNEPNDCFITNFSVIKAVLKFLNQVSSSRILIVESPIQFCRIEEIVTPQTLQEWQGIVTNGTVEFIDLRRTVMDLHGSTISSRTDRRGREEYIDFDLGEQSFFKEKEKLVRRFRVTDYPPYEMKKFHKKGMHKYRVARELIHTEWIINLPKLKTHQKAGFTGCMKNFIGTIGNKECLPHHIKGSPLTGGDCHSDISLLKLGAEELKDLANCFITNSSLLYRVNNKAAMAFLKLHRCFSQNSDISGSWYGNDTIARTIRDVNKIIYYGGRDGRIHTKIQRQVISLVDAIVVGEGDGPLRPFPVKKNCLLCGNNTLAVDIVNASVLGFDYRRIPQTRLKVNPERVKKIKVFYNRQEIPLEGISQWHPKPVKPAPGWAGHIEEAAR